MLDLIGFFRESYSSDNNNATVSSGHADCELQDIYPPTGI